MFKRTIYIISMLGLYCLNSSVANAGGWGICNPVGSPNVYSVNMTKTITDTTKNVSGTVFDDFFSWNQPNGFTMNCECPNDSSTTFIYVKAVSPLAPGYSDGTKQYYIANKYIQFATSVLISGEVGKYFYVPFVQSNRQKNRSGCSDNPSASFYSGSAGTLSLYISSPFVGEMVIPETTIASIYISRLENTFGSTEAASVVISGTITVPQGCEMTSGSTLEIPFGEFQARDFKDRKGQSPVGSTPITKTLEFKCTNISDGVKIYLRLEGTPNASESNAIDLGNPDIGAVTENSSGQIMIPNDTQGQQLNVSALTDETHRSASTELKFYPISTTGKMPAAGDFEGIATLRIDVE